MGIGSARNSAGADDGRPSLRTRLALAFALLALAVALGQAVVLFVTTERAEEALIDRILDEQLQRSAALYRTQPQFAFPNTGDMTLYVTEPGDPAPLPSWLRALPAETGRHELHPAPDLEVHVAVRRDADRVLYLVYDVAEHEQRRRDSIAMLAISVLAAAAFGLLVARGLARRLLADLERLAAAVRGRADGFTGADRERLVPLAGHAETSTLAHALDDEHARAVQALARERAFAAAANHELRTPLMRASSTLELLETRIEDPAQRTLLRRLQSAHEDLRSLTDALLRVARGRTAESAAPCAPHAIVEGVFARAGEDARARGIALSNRVPEDLRVRVDAGSLVIVVQNLVINAIRHSGARRLAVDFADNALTVADDGAGMAPARPVRSGAPAGAVASGNGLPGTASSADDGASRGSGLGLAIVDRVCDANGWSWAIGAGPEGGTRVTLRLLADDQAGEARA